METNLFPPYIAYETKAFNHLLYQCASSKRRDELPTTTSSITTTSRRQRFKFCRNFYRCGASVGLLTSLSSVFLLLYIIFHAVVFSPSMAEASTASAAVLTPLVPGVNVPYVHVIYIFVGYAASTLIHEIGHALAMATVGAHVEGLGWFIMCGLPGAYVSCDVHTVQSLKPHRALRVYFAGVFHNVLFVLFIILTVFVWRWTPVLPSMIYQSGDGVSILSIQGVQERQETQASDDVASVARVVSVGTREWLEWTTPGSSREATILAQEWLESGVNIGARIISINDLPTSDINEYETVLISIMKERKQQNGRSSNGTTMDIRFASGPPFVLPWTSSPEFLYERITVVESRPGVLLHGVCSLCQWWCLSLPLVVMMSLSYTASISAGLAFINSLPVFWLDGDDALGAWLQLLMPKAMKKKVELVRNVILALGTLLLLLVTGLSFFHAVDAGT